MKYIVNMCPPVWKSRFCKLLSTQQSHFGMCRSLLTFTSHLIRHMVKCVTHTVSCYTDSNLGYTNEEMY